MAKEFIKIGGARQHNLKNLSLTIPRDKLVVITGLSGSGKSSLAFDTIYAEGQRKYVESLSAYARQFLDQMEKPDVDFIEGLSPAIAIEQRVSGANPRSIIATTTEIYDYLRLLYSSAGKPHDPESQAATLELALRVLETAPGPRTTVQNPLRWSDNPDWKLDFSNIARLSPEEIARRRAEFDRQKEIAKTIRDRPAAAE